MKKIKRKVPQSVKVQRRIDAAVEQSNAKNKRFYDGLIHRREQKHVSEITALQKEILTTTPQLLVSKNNGVVVSNWRNSWKWMSNIAFALIIAIQAFFDTLPPELIATLPHDAQSKITMALAVLGVIGRFINQSRQPKLKTEGDQ